MSVYRFRLRDGAGTYVTDAPTRDDAQAELVEHFMRPVECWDIDAAEPPRTEKTKSPLCTVTHIRPR